MIANIALIVLWAGIPLASIAFFAWMTWEPSQRNRPDTRQVRIRKKSGGFAPDIYYVQRGRFRPTILGAAPSAWDAVAAMNKILKETK